MSKTTYNLTVNNTTSGIASQLSNNDLVNVEATLNNAGATLLLGASTNASIPTLEVSAGGTVVGGIIKDSDGLGVVAAGGTLQGVTLQGTLTVASSSLYIAGGLTAEGANGTGSGAITLGAALYFDNTQTITADVITMTTSASIAQYTTAAAANQSETLTFGTSLIIDQASGVGYIDSAGSYSSTTNSSAIANKGQINVMGVGSTLEIAPTAFTNSGTLDSEGTVSTLWVYSNTFVNTGAIDVSSSDTFELGNGVSYNYTTASAFGGTINAGSGTIELNATLNNSGATLSIGSGSGVGTLALSNFATVNNGIIHDGGSGFSSQGGTLNNVEYEGNLNLQNGYVYIDDDLTATGAGGTGAGAITLDDSTAYVLNTQTLTNATVTMTNGSVISQNTSAAAYNAYGGYPPETLTLGPTLIVDQNAGTGYISSTGSFSPTLDTSTVVNKGQINVQGSGSVLIVDPTSFTNSGTLNAAGAGTTLWIYANKFTNNGTIAVASGDTVELGYGAAYVYTTGAALGGVINASSGTIEIGGTLNNTAATVSIGAGSHIGTLKLATGGVVVGGTIHDAGSGIAGAGGTLNNVTYRGLLTLSGGSLFIDDDITATGLNGTGAGSVAVSGGILYLDNTQTFDNATVTLTNGGNLAEFVTRAAYNQNPSQILTLGANLNVDVTAGTGFISTSGNGLSGAVVNDGTLAANGPGSTLYVTATTFTDNGIVEATDFGTVNLSSAGVANLSADANYNGDDILTGGIYEAVDAAGNGNTHSLIGFYGATEAISTLAATVDLVGDDATLTSNNINLSASLRDIATNGALNLSYNSLSGTQATFDDTTTSLTVDGAVTLYGGVLQAVALTVDATGVITGIGESNGAAAEIAEINCAVTNNGAIVAGAASLGNPSGSPESRLVVTGDVTNSGVGQAQIQGNTILEFQGADKGGKVVFENTETTEPQTLLIDAATVSSTGQFTSAIAGLVSNDVIDLAKFSGETNYTFNGATLTVTFTHGGTASLTLSGLTGGAAFAFNGDGASGTNITLAPCYCRGTRIKTPSGEVAIEDLREGDLVTTESGAPRPVIWIGRRAIEASKYPEPEKVWPVRIEAGAFGDQQPSRDLWVSPGHNIAVLGALAPAIALINGHSVAQIETEWFEYWHLELDRHDVILAEGLPAESYLDTGNRHGFTNGGDFLQLFPDFTPRDWTDTCLPIVQDGPKVSEIKRLLIDRLLARGYEITAESDVHLDAAGRRIDPIWLSERRLAFVAPKGRRSLSLKSRVFTPAHVVAQSSDTRTLGLSVERLQIDGEVIALDQIAGAGWHAPESDAGQFKLRWTDGAAALPPATRIIIVDLAGQGSYWRDHRAYLHAAAA